MGIGHGEIKEYWDVFYKYFFFFEQKTAYEIMPSLVGSEMCIRDSFSDGLAAVELRFSPQFIASMTGLDADDVIDAVSDAAAGAGLPIEVGLIGIVVRDEGPGSAAAQVRRLLRHKSALAGADLAGDEAGYPAALFAPAFRLARVDR